MIKWSQRFSEETQTTAEQMFYNGTHVASAKLIGIA
jgi:hypothetical protein